MNGGAAGILAIGGVDKITACVIERVEQSEALLLVHGAHTILLPFVADAHGTKSNGREVDSSKRRELAEATKLGFRGRWRGPVV